MSDAYHLQSIRSAYVREALGGIRAVDSHLFQSSVAALLTSGLTVEQIIEQAKPFVEDI